MISIFRIALICAIAILSNALPALAKTVIRANSTVRAEFTVSTRSDCINPAKPKYRIKKKPDHGRLVIKWELSRIEKIAKRCKNHIRGLAIYYTPDRGYRGPDSFIVDITYPRFEMDAGSTTRRIKEDLIIK